MVKWNLVPIDYEGEEIYGLILKNKENPSDYILIYVIENDIVRYIISRSVYHSTRKVYKEDQWCDPKEIEYWYNKDEFFEEKGIGFNGEVRFKETITPYIKSKNKYDKFGYGDNYNKIVKCFDKNDEVLDKYIIKNSLAVAYGEVVLFSMVFVFILIGVALWLGGWI